MSTAKFKFVQYQERYLASAYAVFCEGRSAPWSIESFAETVQRHHCLLATNQDGLAGLVIYSIVLGEAELLDLCTSKQHRRGGIAQELLQMMASHLIQEKVNRVLLEVARSNEAAISLYKKIDFVHIDVRQNYYQYADGEKEDALIFEKRI